MYLCNLQQHQINRMRNKHTNKQTSKQKMCNKQKIKRIENKTKKNKNKPIEFESFYVQQLLLSDLFIQQLI